MIVKQKDIKNQHLMGITQKLSLNHIEKRVRQRGKKIYDVKVAIMDPTYKRTSTTLGNHPASSHRRTCQSQGRCNIVRPVHLLDQDESRYVNLGRGR
jgi:hypothetical protein